MNSKDKQDTNKIYRAVVIGAGDIGSGADGPDSSEFLTHAHGIAENPSLELRALVDTDGERAEAEAGRWNTNAYTDIEQMFAIEKPDIVVIATPDDTHTQMLEHVLTKDIKLVVLEKPVATNDAEAERLSKLQPGIPVVVNFRRRFDPIVIGLADALRRGEHGHILSAHGTYVRGILHNGSHMLDLARLLFGEIRSAAPDSSSVIHDFPEGLPTIGGTAVFERCPTFRLTAADGREKFIFELEIVTEKARFHFTDEGMKLTEQTVTGKAHTIKTGLDMAFPALYAHVVAILEGKETSRSTLDNALKTHAACMLFAAGSK